MEQKNLNRLRVIIAEKGLTNKWLSEQIGVGQATVSKWVQNNAFWQKRELSYIKLSVPKKLIGKWKMPEASNIGSQPFLWLSNFYNIIIHNIAKKVNR